MVARFVMKSNKKRILFVLAILTMALVLSCALVACNKTDTTDAPKKEFTITFDTQGGSEVKPITIAEGATITLPNNPTKEGSVFDGWYLDSLYAQAFDITKRIDSNMVLYAKWRILDDGQSIIASDYFDINGLVLTMNKKNYIPSTEDVFDLQNKFSTSIGSSWRAFTSPNCDQPTEITTRTANVSAGWNNIYVMVENLTTYENKIYRLKIYKYPTIVYKELEDGFWEIQSVSDCADVLFPNDKIDNITSIGERAFSSCPSLRTLSNLPKLTYIGPSAFANCKSLTSITIPDSVTSIGAYAFDGCSEITSISGSSDVISKVAKQASPKSFVGNITSGTSVMAGAFSGMTGLKGVTIPDSVTSIGSSAFSGCNGLTTVNWNATACTSAGYSGHPIFEGCSNLATVNIGDNVKIIPSYAFYNCTGLTSVTIPDSVTSIGSSAFYNTAWYNNQPDGLVYAGKVAYKYKGSMPSNTSIVLKEGTFGIADYAFAGCTGLTSITIPNSVTSIGSSAFSGCAGLTSITVAKENTKYHSAGNCLIETESETLIAGCKNSIIPTDGSVTSIGSSAFSSCTGLTSVTIPDSVTSIGSSAFYRCIGLTTVNWNATACTSAGYSGHPIFEGCSNLATVNIGDNVKIIPSDAFYNCIGLTSVTIPDSVTSIGSWAFKGCKGLTSVTIGNGVTSIGNMAFADCTGLTSVTIGGSVTSIGSNAFSYTAWYDNQSDGLVYAGKVAYTYKGTMPSNTSIVLKKGTLGIADYAFAGCTGLTSITIPYSVTSIGYSAFRG